MYSCAFIDYRKAFDSINRPLLGQKLLSYNINGKLFNVVKNMYDKAKFCVKIENLYSDYFPCNIRVRQGDNLSPLLYALFINDFSHYVGGSYKGLCVSKSSYPSLENEDALFLKLFVLLYADDTIILAENERDLQTALDSVQEYCSSNARVHVWISTVGNQCITESHRNSLYDSSTSVSNKDIATRISKYNEKRCKCREFCKS